MRKYQNVNIEKLKPYKRNARTHSAEQIEKIAKSIKEFGFINPVLIDGDFGIIAGHGRIEGAKKLGMTEVPCLFIEDLSETQKRAYIIADNKLAEDAGWDDELLKFELGELADLDFDISLTGFDNMFCHDNATTNEFERSKFIDKLLEEDFVDLNPNKDVYSVSFVFPIKMKKTIQEYINKNGKEYLTEIIISEVQNA